MPAQEKVGGKATAKRRMPDGITLPLGDNSGPETAKRRRRLQQPNTSFILDAAATLATSAPSSPPDRKSAHAALAADEGDEEDAEEEVEEHAMADGTTVLKGSDGTLYDLESFDAIGKWNSEDNTFIDDENIAATSAGASAAAVSSVEESDDEYTIVESAAPLCTTPAASRNAKKSVQCQTCPSRFTAMGALQVHQEKLLMRGKNNPCNPNITGTKAEQEKIVTVKAARLAEKEAAKLAKGAGAAAAVRAPKKGAQVGKRKRVDFEFDEVVQQRLSGGSMFPVCRVVGCNTFGVKKLNGLCKLHNTAGAQPPALRTPTPPSVVAGPFEFDEVI